MDTLTPSEHIFFLHAFKGGCQTSMKLYQWLKRQGFQISSNCTHIRNHALNLVCSFILINKKHTEFVVCYMVTKRIHAYLIPTVWCYFHQFIKQFFDETTMRPKPNEHAEAMKDRRSTFDTKDDLKICKIFLTFLSSIDNRQCSNVV